MKSHRTESRTLPKVHDLCSPLFTSVLLWTTLCGCIDEPPAPSSAVARLVTAWDPLGCGDPHRVVVELEDDSGAKISASAPCSIGGLTLDVAHFGIYHGRIYAWAFDAPMRSVTLVDVTIDEPIVHWQVSVPR